MLGRNDKGTIRNNAHAVLLAAEGTDQPRRQEFQVQLRTIDPGKVAKPRKCVDTFKA